MSCLSTLEQFIAFQDIWVVLSTEESPSLPAYQVFNSLNRKCVSSGSKQHSQSHEQAISSSSLLTGTWQVDQNKCRPGANCCCADGELNIQQGEHQGTVLASGKLTDLGMGGCFGRTDFKTVFTLDSPSSAHFKSPDLPGCFLHCFCCNFFALHFHIKCSVSVSLWAKGNSLNFTNSLYPGEDCISAATLTTSEVASNNGIDNSESDAADAQETSGADKIMSNPRDFEGWYSEDGSCVQSTSCCCGTGALFVGAGVDSSTLNLRFRQFRPQCVLIVVTFASQSFCVHVHM